MTLKFKIKIIFTANSLSNRRCKICLLLPRMNLSPHPVQFKNKRVINTKSTELSFNFHYTTRAKQSLLAAVLCIEMTIETDTTAMLCKSLAQTSIRNYAASLHANSSPFETGASLQAIAKQTTPHPISTLYIKLYTSFPSSHQQSP